MSEWHTINTAPKDGSAILTFGAGTYGVAVWCACKRRWLLVERDGNRPDRECPVEWEGVTHWMPLPEPPE